MKPNIDLDADELYSYLQPFVEPARYETFQFSREWMRSQFQRITDVRSTSAKTAFKLNLPPSYALIHRVWSGGIGVLAQLGTEAPFRSELERWLPGFTDEPVIGADDGQASPAPAP